MRILITFAKTEAMRFTGHLDLFRAWERTFRRAGIRLAYTRGYKPHPRLNLACALPLGFTSNSELLEAWLQDELPLEKIWTHLETALPPGLVIRQVERLDPTLPALQHGLLASDYTLTLLDPLPDLEARLAALLAAKELPRQRRGKPYDLRALIQTIERLPDDPSGKQRLRLRLDARPASTGRPEEVILALGGEAHRTHVHREGLHFADTGGKT